MVLVEPEKKGGPYTKKEQEERRLEVYRLHYEENYSAVKIAERLNVNRNTVSEDLKFWDTQFAREIKTHNLVSKLKSIIQKIEIQRSRLLEELENTNMLSERITIEKFIHEIDKELIQLYSKMIIQGKNSLDSNINEEIKEYELKEFVRNLILLNDDPYSEDVYSLEDLKFEFIRKTKCDVEYAERVLKKMKNDGLNLCEKPKNLGIEMSVFGTYVGPKYILVKFAILRGFVTAEELAKITQKREKNKNEIEKEEKGRKERFIKKYGPESKWSDEIWEKFDETDEEP